MAIRVGINGFGRIGRLFYRVAAERRIEVVAVDDLVPSDNLAYLLKYDTTHRRITVDGKATKVSSERIDGFAVSRRERVSTCLDDEAIKRVEDALAASRDPGARLRANGQSRHHHDSRIQLRSGSQRVRRY